MYFKYMFLVVLPFLASASQKINLAPVPHGDSFADVHPAYSLVKKGGVLYKRFSSGDGELYVIDSQPLKKETIEAGKCTRFRARGGSAEKTDVEVLRADVAIPRSDWKIFGGIIQATIQDKCSETQVALKQPPALQLGISKTVTGKDGNRKTYQIFNIGLQRNLNFGMQF